MKTKRAFFLVAVLLLMAVLAGCSGRDSGYSSSAAADSGARMQAYDDVSRSSGEAGMGGVQDYEAPAEAVKHDEAAASEVAIDSEAEIAPIGGEPMPPEDQPRKIIYTVDLTLQTTQFDDAVAQVPALVEEFGGFVQDSYVEGTNMYEKYYSRSASFTVRVPSEKLDAFIQSSGESFHIVSQHKQSSDITGNYYDTKSRLDSLRIQEERLKAMLEGATELQYMLEVERELADVLYQIESMTSALARMDSSVDYSTVTLYLQEVNLIDDNQPVVEPITFGERAQETLGGSWDGFLRLCGGVVLTLIALVPFLPIIAVVAVILIVVLRGGRKRRAARRAQAAQHPPLTSVRGNKKKQQQETDGEPDPDNTPKE